MRTRHLLVTVALACSLSSGCDSSSSQPPLVNHNVSITYSELHRLCPGEDVQIGPENKTIPFKLEPGTEWQMSSPFAGWERGLDKISIVSSPGSSPPSVIVSGRVLSFNTGTPEERLSVFIGREGEPLRLAGMTNADGEFKFRLRVQDNHDLGVQIPPDFSSFLYVHQPFVSSGDVYRRYSFLKLREVSEATAISADKQGNP